MQYLCPVQKFCLQYKNYIHFFQLLENGAKSTKTTTFYCPDDTVGNTVQIKWGSHGVSICEVSALLPPGKNMFKRFYSKAQKYSWCTSKTSKNLAGVSTPAKFSLS